MTEFPEYLIEADNPDGTFETVGMAGILLEAEHELRKCAHLEGMRPQGARRLSLWHKSYAVCIGIWIPYTAQNPNMTQIIAAAPCIN